MGRKKKDKELTRTHLIALRLTDAEYEIINEIAKEARLTASSYIRKQVFEKQVCIKHEIVADIKEINTLTAELGKIGSNLNQIAKYFNTNGIRSNAMEAEIRNCISMLFSLRTEILKIGGNIYGGIETYLQ